jgi:rfaE bifunctional protein nucleotidyltransferase chain/domain
MRFHRDRRATRISLPTSIGPTGSGGIGPSASLSLALDEGASLLWRRLASDPMAFRTIATISMTQDTSPESLDSLGRRLAALKSEGKRIVFTNGCFDVLHGGHIRLLRDAAAQGDVLVVAINGDASVARLKGASRPVFPARERAEVLSALEMVDFVCVFGQDTPLDAILKLRPDVLVKGADWEGEVVGREEVEGWGGRVVMVPLVPGRSTTDVLDRVRARLERPESAG